MCPWLMFTASILQNVLTSKSDGVMRMRKCNYVRLKINIERTTRTALSYDAFSARCPVWRPRSSLISTLTSTWYLIPLTVYYKSCMQVY